MQEVWIFSVNLFAKVWKQQNQHTRELISAWNMWHKYKNEDWSRLW